MTQLKQQLEAIEREQRKKAAEDEDMVQILSLLVKHPGFIKYQELLDKMLLERGKVLLEPLENLLMIPASEHHKGTMYGLALAKDLPSTIIQAAQDMKSVDGDADDGE